MVQIWSTKVPFTDLKKAQLQQMVQNGDVKKKQLQQMVQNEDAKPAGGRAATVQPLHSRGFAFKYDLNLQ